MLDRDNTNLLVAHFVESFIQKRKTDNDKKKALVMQLANPTNFVLTRIWIEVQEMYVAGISLCIFYLPKNKGIHI
jgi:hypothetical protein